MSSAVLEKKVQGKKSGSTLKIESLRLKGYEEVLRVTDATAGLSAIIAIHNRSLGPALGGIRIQPYPTFEAALQDVLRLSHGMTYKSAIAGVGFGGGKTVIIADPKKDKTPKLLQAFGAAVDSLGGGYICAEDVGCTVDDVAQVRKATQYVVGLPHAKSSGDPGPFTAWGTFRGIQATARKLFGTDSLVGRTVAVQGLGNVGEKLIEFLFWAGARLILSDLDRAKLEKLATKYAAQAVPTQHILGIECDILAPCALGGIVNDHTLPYFNCRGIAGSANNQLLHESHGEQLRARGILYAPDFVINAGGLLNVAAELEEEGYNPSYSQAKIHQIYNTLLAIYDIADKNRQSTHEAAVALADYRIKYQVGKRIVPPTFHHS